MARLFVVVVVVLLSSVASAQEMPALYRVTGVAADDALNIRAEPDARSPILGVFAPDRRAIEVTGLSHSGRWARVNTGEGVGWAALRFLERDGVEDWRDGKLALTCFGTEPFWRMPIFLPTHHAEFHDIDSGGFELVTDAGALPRTHYPPTMAIPFSGSREGVAVVRGATCSDGMSDRLYGLEAQVYWRGDTVGLSGCCSLVD